jgi:hypothetical protein
VRIIVFSRKFEKASHRKHKFADRMNFSRMSDDLVLHSLQFAADSLSVVLSWKLVSSHWKKLASNPIVVAYVSVNFRTLQDVERMGSLARGVRTAIQSTILTLPGLPSLRALSLTNIWTSSADLDAALSALRHLETLELGNVRYFEVLQVPSSVWKVKVQNAPNLKRIHGSANLRELTVDDCARLSAISNAPELKVLNTYGCNLELYHTAHSLEELRLHYDSMHDLNWASSLKELRSLVIWHCDALQNLDGLSRLGKLTLVRLSGRRIDDGSLWSLAGLGQLRTLEIGSDLITDEGLQAVCKLHELRKLHLNGIKITDQGLAHVSALSALTVLSLKRTLLITDLAPLSRLTNLKVLSLSCLTDVDSLAPLTKLENLASLTLEHCRSVCSLRDLSGMPALDRVSLQHCSRLSREGLMDLWPSRVTRLHICGSRFEDFGGVQWSVEKWDSSEDCV